MFVVTSVAAWIAVELGDSVAAVAMVVVAVVVVAIGVPVAGEPVTTAVVVGDVGGAGLVGGAGIVCRDVGFGVHVVVVGTVGFRVGIGVGGRGVGAGVGGRGIVVVRVVVAGGGV